MAKAVRNEKTTEATVPTVAKVDEPVVSSKEEPILVNFDRWFAHNKFRPQWKLGMQAFTDTTGRKSMAEWDAIFKAY
jgi:hypothetical protein